MHKTILIILDGLSARVAQTALGYMTALVETQQAIYHTIAAALPSNSRPLYETLLTGKTPLESGITHNAINRLSRCHSVFSLAKHAGLTTAAASYHWVSELYNHSPYNPFTDRYQFHNQQGNITHGIFYHQDHYPDESLFQDADYLRRQYQPHFLLVHSMNIDDAGHRFGASSREYHNAARHADGLLALYLPQWLDDGYRLIVTADHGMNWDHNHGGSSDDDRQVPFYALGDKLILNAPTPKQTQIAASLCASLGLSHPDNNALNFWSDHA